jgi:hypothetical protein
VLLTQCRVGVELIPPQQKSSTCFSARIRAWSGALR